MIKLYSYRIVKWKSAYGSVYYKIQFRKNTLWGKLFGWDDVVYHEYYETQHAAKTRIVLDMTPSNLTPNEKPKKEKLPKVVWEESNE